MPAKSPAPVRAPAGKAPEPAAPSRSSPTPAAKLTSARASGGGEPLPASVAALIASSFRPFTSPPTSGATPGSGAASAAASHGAHAFAQGSDIVLGSAARANDLPLMAHEVAHVVQQRRAPAIQLYQPHAADRSSATPSGASAVVGGGAVAVQEQVATPQVQRLGLSDALDYFADKANIIPGFRMFTIILGINPINMSRVSRPRRTSCAHSSSSCRVAG